MRPRTAVPLLLLVALTAPLAPAVTAAGGTTLCTGGETNGDAIAVGDVYLDLDGATVWEETNGKAGLQQTDRICRELNAENRVVRTWIDTPADAQVSMGPPGPPNPPNPPPVPRCLTPNLCII